MEPSERFEILVHVQPWQALLLDPQALIDLAAGQMGATGLTLSVQAADAIDVIALDPSQELIAARVAAGALHPAEARHYASTRLRPQVSPTLKGRPLTKLADLCRERSLALHLRLSALRDAALAGHYPDVVARNALSLPVAGHLCPSNPDAVELVRCRLSDLAARFGPDLIEVEGFLWPDRYQPSGDTAACWPVPPGAVEAALLAVCFCPSCQQQAIAAGLDAASALRSVQVHLRRWLRKETPRPGTMTDLLADDPIVADYLARQRQSLLQAVKIWHRGCANLSLVVRPAATAPHIRAASTAHAPAEDETPAHAAAGDEPAAHTPAEDEPADTLDASAAQLDLIPGTRTNGPAAAPEPRTGSPWNPSFEQLVAAVGRLTLLASPDACIKQCRLREQTEPPAPVRFEAAIDAATPALSSGPEIVRCLSELARAGVAGIVLNGGLNVSPTRRPFIRQAIRAARRQRTM